MTESSDIQENSYLLAVEAFIAGRDGLPMPDYSDAPEKHRAVLVELYEKQAAKRRKYYE